MTEPVLLIEKSDGVAALTLNRPEAMNALSFELRTSLTRAFRELDADPDVRVLILTGAGRAFCAGLDLKELERTGVRVEHPDATSHDYDIVGAMTSFAGPIIGAINGVAVTGGFEIALACDVLIAAPEARFADTHARVGIMPGWGLSQRLSRAIGIYRAKEVSLTGNFVSARQAEDWGLVNRVVAAEELLPTARRMAADMLSCVPEMLSGYKRVIDEGFAANFAEGLRIEQRRSRESLVDVTAEAIGRRRRDVQKRGREQTAG